jgi:hypothetical protein
MSRHSSGVAFELIPSAGRLATSLRDIGYDTPAAVADLVDNSIGADATSVSIEIQFDGNDSWVRVTDDGIGMSDTVLMEAMRFGSRREYGSHELGKFGLGLKAASLSQCRCVTVATRRTAKSPVRVARWDLDHLEQSDRWEVRRMTATDCPEAAAPLAHRVGTVVLWEKLDRMLHYKVPNGRWALDALAKLSMDIEDHLAMVFHRYLAGEVDGRPGLTISLNGETIQPWDPFSRDEPATISLPEQRLRVSHGGRAHAVLARPYVLPSEARFSGPAAHRRASGPLKWNRQQGLYIYRCDRLIQAGGWNRLRTVDEHTKLARISIDIPTELDALFRLNVSKTQVRVPTELRGDLAAIAASVARVAQDAYRRHSTFDSIPSGTAEEPRTRAAAQLVRLVMDGVEQVLRDEMKDDTHRYLQLLNRLHQMESRFCEQLLSMTSRPASQEAPASSVISTAPA